MPLTFPRLIRALAASAVIAIMAAHPAHAEGPTSIPWRTDLARAKSESASTGRPLWIQFTGPWCYNCRRMDAEAFTQTDVVGYAGSAFVPVKLAADEHEQFALGFGLSCLPATVILRPSGEVVSRVQGYNTPDAFLVFLRDALTRAGGSTTSTARKDAGSPRRTALAGYCPVSLVDAHRLRPGGHTASAEFEGITYRFVDARARETFQKAPARYVQVDAGRCPVARVDLGEARTGSPRWGALYGGHLYLCGSERDRARFLKHPDRYARVDLPLRDACPHCWALDGGIVAARRSPTLARGGRLSLSSDPDRLGMVLKRAETRVR